MESTKYDNIVIEDMDAEELVACACFLDYEMECFMDDIFKYKFANQFTLSLNRSKSFNEMIIKLNNVAITNCNLNMIKIQELTDNIKERIKDVKPIIMAKPEVNITTEFSSN